jgi:hypothetical protein
MANEIGRKLDPETPELERESAQASSVGRRRLIKGMAAGLPLVFTLRSGTAMAMTSSLACLKDATRKNAPTPLIPQQGADPSGVSWLRQTVRVRLVKPLNPSGKPVGDGLNSQGQPLGGALNPQGQPLAGALNPQGQPLAGALNPQGQPPGDGLNPQGKSMGQAFKIYQTIKTPRPHVWYTEAGQTISLMDVQTLRELPNELGAAFVDYNGRQVEIVRVSPQNGGGRPITTSCYTSFVVRPTQV